MQSGMAIKYPDSLQQLATHVCPLSQAIALRNHPCTPCALLHRPLCIFVPTNPFATPLHLLHSLSPCSHYGLVDDSFVRYPLLADFFEILGAEFRGKKGLQQSCIVMHSAGMHGWAGLHKSGAAASKGLLSQPLDPALLSPFR